MTRNRVIAILLILVVVVLMAFLGKSLSKKKVVPTTAQIQKDFGVPVRVANVVLGSIDETVPVTGDIKALNSVSLSAKTGGKVSSVLVREGDAVRRGQVVVQIDPSDAESNLRQAQAGLQTALARLSQARTSVTVTEVQSQAAIQQAKSALTAAQSNLQKVKTGARSQERLIAENQVATAKANLDNAQSTLKRYKSLYDQGAIAAAQLDNYQTQYDVALAGYNTAKQSLSLVQEGARTEDVSTAEQQVNQARDALTSAKANAGQNALRQEDVKSAQAGVAQAQAQVAIARDALSNTSIRSSVDGIVSQRMVDPGQSVGQNVAIMIIVNVQTVYFEANVSETVLSKIRPGQTVDSKVDAYPDQTFVGTVDKINPSAATNTRNFGVRIRIANLQSRLRPGMFARGSVVTGGTNGAVLIPQDAVETRNGVDIAFTVYLDGKDKKFHARKHVINKGLSNPQFVELNAPSDIRVGDTVVTSGHESLDDNSMVLKGG